MMHRSKNRVTFQSVARVKRRAQCNLQERKCGKNNTGSVTCNTGHHMINCVFQALWKTAPPVVRSDVVLSQVQKSDTVS